MNIRARKGFKLDLLMGELAKGSRPSRQGTVTFSGWTYEHWTPVIVSAVEFPRALSALGQHRVVHEALMAAAKKGALDEKGLIAELRAATHSYIRQKQRPYVIASQIAVQVADRSVSRLKRATVTLTARLPARFRAQHEGIANRDPGRTQAPIGAAWVRTTVRARDPHEAVELGSRELDFLRGIWLLAYTRGRFSLSFGVHPPLNPFVLGPAYSVHHRDGSLAHDSPWWEHGYHRPGRIEPVARHWTNVRKLEARFRGYLRRIGYAPIIEDAVRRYARALDSTEWDTVFVKLWSILEGLTVTGHSSYDVTIRRASLIYRDRDARVQVLRHLREYRNRVVHRDETRQDNLTAVQQLKDVIEDMLVFHVFRKRVFRTVEEVARFLDLPPDRALLRAAVSFFST